MPTNLNVNPELDLLLERTVDVPADRVWEAWTKPELLKQWFCPRPWHVSECELDLRPGGRFRTVMKGPEGEEFDGVSCVLLVEERHKFVWTSALEGEFRPKPADAENFTFTATILIEPEGNGTRYTALVRHATPEQRQSHAEMGFDSGWSTALDQLVEMVKNG